MRNKSSLLMIACTVLFFLSLNFSEASTWYVRKTGNDTKSGNSIDSAKLTIQAMINTGAVVNGDVIDIGAGTYQEQVVIDGKSLTLQGAGSGSTIIQAPAWASMTTYTDATLLYWNTVNIAASLPTSSFKPVVYVNAPSNSYTVNFYGIQVDGNGAAPAAPGQLFVGIMYKNAQGTVGASATNYPVLVQKINGAGGSTENTVFGFGIVCMGTANPLIQYSTFQTIHNASIASIGRSLSTTLVSQMPNPTVRDNTITGASKNNTGWYAGLMTAYGGRVTAQRNLIVGFRNAGQATGQYTGGVLIYDGRTALIGSNSVKSDGNTITDNDWGMNVYVTNSIIGTPSNYTIKNNTIAYNGNTGSGLTCTGAVLTSGCVRYHNTTSIENRTLALSTNAWGHADPLNNGYGISTTTAGGASVTGLDAGTVNDAFFVVTEGDAMSVTSPAFAATENVNPAYTYTTAGWGYSAFNTIQRAIDAAGNPSTVLVAGSNTYTENVCIFSKKNVTIVGDSTATCGSGTKPIINPPSDNGFHIYTLNSTDLTQNIIVNGFYFQQAGTQRAGILVTGWDNTSAASNNPPSGTQVRNTCFAGYATQVADGTAPSSAAMSTEEYTFAAGTGRISWGGLVPPATANASDIDAQANNNFNVGGVSTSPSFKLWEKADGFAFGGYADYRLARILQTNLIIVYCGDDLNVALGALGTSPVTVYLQGDCIYKSAAQLTIAGPFDIKVDYTGRQQLPPLVVEPNGIIYSNAAQGIMWATDCDITGKPGIRFVTNGTQLPLAASLTNGHYPSGTVANASATYMKTLTPVNYTAGFDYKWTNYGTNRPANITVSGNNTGALLDAISHSVDTNGFAGTVTLGNGAAYTTNVDLQKRIRFSVAGAGNATTSGWIRLRNKVLPNGPDCATSAGVGALDGILDTRVTSGTFTSTDVRVGTPTSGSALELADNTDTTNTIDQGLVLTAANGTTTVNYRGDYTAQAPTMIRSNVTLTSDDATNFVGGNSGAGSPLTSITLNGSGNCASMSDIVRFDVPLIYMANNTDCIQTALGTATNQDDEGVGNDDGTGVAVPAGATPRVGTITFQTGGAITPSQPITLEKDVVFNGLNATPNTNNNTLTMNLGAYRTVGGNISLSDNFCNTTVQATQAAGSGYTGIPDIQDAINLTCLSGTLNIGTTAAATTWGAGTDTYNRDNTIDSSITVQGTNTTNACANDPAFVIDAASAWPVNAGRSAFTSTFSGFTTTNPVFTIASGVNSVTIRGFDFTSLTQSTANAVIYAAGTGANVNNSVTISGNVYTNSSEQFVKSAGSGVAATYHTGWTVDCNRMVPNANMVGNFVVELIDHTGTTYNRNMYDGTGCTNTGHGAILFRGLGGGTLNNITSNLFRNHNINAALYLTGSTNSTGNVMIEKNTIRNNAFLGLNLNTPESYTAAVTVRNNFISTNGTVGIYLEASAIITHQFLSINNNSITGNATGLWYTNNGATACGINARGNWWNNASGPTNTYNPLNVTPGTATAFGDPVSNNGTWGTDPTRISYIPWWTISTDAAAGTDGWQEPAATNALGRVTRTNAAGAWQASYTTINAAAAAAAASDRILIMQGMPHWTPAPGPTGSSAWGAYFSEYVTGLTNVTGVEFRGVTNSEYNCTASAVQTAVTYIAGTDNTTNPVPTTIGAAIAPTTGTISGSTGNGNAFEISGAGRANTTIRNLRIQGYSSTTPSSNPPMGAGIMATQTSGLVVDGVWFEGGSTSNTKGSWGIALDRTTSSTLTSNKFGTNRDIASTSGGLGGVSVLAADAANSATAVGPNTIGQNAAFSAISTGLGFLNGNNLLSNNERAAIQIGGGGATSYTAGSGGTAGATLIQYNTINGSRDAKGTGGAASLAAIYLDPVGGTPQVNNNTIGSTTLGADNNVDIYLGTQTFTFSGSNNTIRDNSANGGVTTGTSDGESWSVTDELGTRGAVLRTFFNPASGNTFSHAAILTTDSRAPYDFSAQMSRNQPVEVIGTPTRIYRDIATPLANTTTTYSAGSSTYRNIVEIRENAAWAIGTRDQYYSENLGFVSTTGRIHQTILGPAAANALNTASAHIINTTGTGVTLTANGAENKYIRGGIVMHAIGSGLYGSIDAAAANKGDVYLQRAASGTDAGFVQFAYHATTFGSQALVTGTGAETTGNNSNTDKPTIIKAGLNDANDDAYTVTTAQNRRTGVFQAGNGTTFTKPTEPVAGLGVDGLTAFPNPSNGGTVTVQFSVPTESMVRVALYDALGRKVTDLREGTLNVGVYNADFDVNNLPSGTYTVRMEYDYSVKTVQVHVIK